MARFCGVRRFGAAGDGDGWNDDPTDRAGVARGGDWVERTDADWKCDGGEYEVVV